MEKRFPKCLTRLGRHNLNSPVQKKSFCVRVLLEGNLIKELSSVENDNKDRFKNCLFFFFFTTIDYNRYIPRLVNIVTFLTCSFRFNGTLIFCNAQFVKQSYARVDAFTGISNLDLYTNASSLVHIYIYIYVRIHLAKPELYLIHVRSRTYDWVDFQRSMSSIIDKR